MSHSTHEMRGIDLNRRFTILPVAVAAVGLLVAGRRVTPRKGGPAEPPAPTMELSDGRAVADDIPYPV